MKTNLPRYSARELAAMPEDQRWAMPSGEHNVVFDDGEVLSTREATIYSSYMWGFYNHCPNMPALMHHHLGDEMVRSRWLNLFNLLSQGRGKSVEDRSLQGVRPNIAVE